MIKEVKKGTWIKLTRDLDWGRKGKMIRLAKAIAPTDDFALVRHAAKIRKLEGDDYVIIWNL